MNDVPVTFIDRDMPTINPYKDVNLPKSDIEMTYPEKKNINEVINHKPRKKDIYETNMHNIYNLIVADTNKPLQDKAASDTTFQAVKIDQDPIRHLIIFRNICFSNQSEQHSV